MLTVRGFQGWGVRALDAFGLKGLGSEVLASGSVFTRDASFFLRFSF